MTNISELKEILNKYETYYLIDAIRLDYNLNKSIQKAKLTITQDGLIIRTVNAVYFIHEGDETKVILGGAAVKVYTDNITGRAQDFYIIKDMKDASRTVKYALRMSNMGEMWIRRVYRLVMKKIKDKTLPLDDFNNHLKRNNYKFELQFDRLYI